MLNVHVFESIAELRALTDAWVRVYNRERPRDSLGRVGACCTGGSRRPGWSLRAAGSGARTRVCADRRDHQTPPTICRHRSACR
jgi:Integrase core domain